MTRMSKKQMKEALAKFTKILSETKYNYFITISLTHIRKCDGFHRADSTDMSLLTDIIKHIANDMRKYQRRYAKRIGADYVDLDFLAFPETKTRGGSENTHPHYHILYKIPGFCDDFDTIIKNRILRLINKKNISFQLRLDVDILKIFDLNGAIKYDLKHILRHDIVGDIVYYSPSRR